jgi:hypothetical protein
MKPQNELFKRKKDDLEAKSGDLLRSADMRTTVNSIVDSLTEEGIKTRTPGISHIRLALNRQFADVGVRMPTGQVFSTIPYDKFRDGDDGEQALEFVSRLYALTNEDTDSGKMGIFFEKLIDGKAPNQCKVLLHAITPTDAGKIFDPMSVTFVVVQVNDGEVYTLGIEPNDNKGKIIPEVALQTEYGELRDQQGWLDKCPFKAVLLEPEVALNIAEELKAVNIMLQKEKNKKQNPTVKEKVKKRIGSIGATLSTKLNPENTKK